jgi:hypothetical protein
MGKRATAKTDLGKTGKTIAKSGRKSFDGRKITIFSHHCATHF